MAYVQNSDLEDEQEQGNGGPVTPGSGTASNAPIDGNQQAQAPAAGQKKMPGRFADLGEYLRVNQGQNFGGQVAGKIGQDINQGQQSLLGAQEQFKQRADANTVKDTNNLIGQVATNPEGIDVNEYAKLRDAQYKGPAALSDTQDLYNQVQGAAGSAVGKANASKTEGGRFALLDSYYGKPSYSQGQKSLDNLLVQNDKNSQQAFDQMRSNANQLQQNVNNAGVELGNYGAQARGQTEAVANQAKNAVTGELGNTKNQINQNYQDVLANQGNQYNLLNQALQSRDISGLSDEQKNLLNFGDLDAYYGVDPSQYLSKGQVTETGAMTPEQLTRYRALEKLAGSQDVYSGQQAGGLGPLLGFDSDVFKNLVGGQKAAYEQALTKGSSSVSGDTDRLNNYLAQLFPDRYQFRNDPDTWITNGQPGPGANKPLTLTNLTQTKSDLEAALNAGFSPGTSSNYKDSVTAALNKALQQVNSDIGTITGQYGADQKIKR